MSVSFSLMVRINKKCAYMKKKSSLLWGSNLQDRNGNLASGAIANLVDEVGGAVVHVEGLPMNVSVDMSISFVSTAKVNVS